MAETELDPELINEVAIYITQLQLKRTQMIIKDKQAKADALEEKLNFLTNEKGVFKMAESNENAKNQSDKVQNYKIYIYQNPEMTTIVPKTGKNAGKTIDVMSVKALHRNYEINDTTGEFVKKDPTFMTLKKYGEEHEDLKQLASLIKPGMQLRVNGYLTSHEYTFTDQKTGELRKQTAIELNANSLMLDLSQQGLKSISFEQQKRENDKQQAPEL
ncbi:MAG: hypothetical protein ACI4NE_06725 [Succinivibrio sp.]